MEASTVISAIVLGMSIIGSVWGFALWIHRAQSAMQEKQSLMQDKLYNKIEQLEKTLLDKLEYHERHDDKRFASVHDEIWEMKLRQAATQGIVAETRKAITQ